MKLSKIESFDGDTPGLVKKLQEFFDTSWKTLFKISVTYLWLEKQITFNGNRRVRRWKNGHVPDQTFSRFMAGEVGVDQAMLTRSRWFNVSSYFMAEYMPDYLDKSPFEDPEYFEWPFKHVSLDFYSYIYQVHARKEMMDYAEEKEFSFLEFKNWANNYVLSYNEEQEDAVYSIGRSRDGTSFIRNKEWDKFPIDALYEATKKDEAGGDELSQI